MGRKAKLCFQPGVRGCKLATAQEDILAQGFCLAGTKELAAYFGCPVLPDNRISSEPVVCCCFASCISVLPGNSFSYSGLIFLPATTSRVVFCKWTNPYSIR